jgi:hypothetical protein
VIVTVKLPVAVLPDGSLAEQVTVVVPRGKVLPLVGVQVTGTVPATASLAVARRLMHCPPTFPWRCRG